MRFRFTLESEYLGSLTLPKDPKGWNEIETVIKRGLEYHGTFYNTMVQLEFTCGSGKEYIDEVYETYGVDGVINITIQIDCGGGSGVSSANDYSDDYSDDYGSLIQSSTAANYQDFFIGTLDLSKYNKNTRSTFVDILQSDFLQKVINRFETTVDVLSPASIDEVALDPITDFPSDITLHSKRIVLDVNYEYFDDNGSLPTIFPIDSVSVALPLIKVVDDIGGALDTTSPYVFSFLNIGGAAGEQNIPPIYENNTAFPLILAIDYNIVGELVIKNTYTSTMNVDVLIQTDGSSYSTDPIYPTILQHQSGIFVNGSTNTTININASGTLAATVAAGDRVYLTFLFGNVEGNNVSPGLFEFLSFTPIGFQFDFSTQSVTLPSAAKIFKIHELGAAIGQRITSQADCFRSNLLGRLNSAPNTYLQNGCGSFMGVLNGKHIRGFAVTNSPLFCSMADYFKTLNSIWNVGIGFEKVADDYFIRLEQKEYFYDTTVLIQCPNANEIKTSVAKEYYISDIYIGYDNWETENQNGLDEFNTKRQYTTGIKSIESRLNVESPMIASMYSIELTRRAGVSTLDYPYDNDNFIICLKRTLDGTGAPSELNLAEKNENFTIATNFKSPATAYNIRISPARNLLNHMNSIAGSIIKYPLRAVKFLYGEGNYTVETQLTADTCSNNFDNELLIENQDITVAEALATPIWIPEYLEFDYPLSFSDFQYIKENPYKCIEVSNTNSNFTKGYIIELRYKPVGGMAYFKLLRAYE